MGTFVPNLGIIRTNVCYPDHFLMNLFDWIVVGIIAAFLLAVGFIYVMAKAMSDKVD